MTVRAKFTLKFKGEQIGHAFDQTVEAGDAISIDIYGPESYSFERQSPVAQMHEVSYPTRDRMKFHGEGRLYTVEKREEPKVSREAFLKVIEERSAVLRDLATARDALETTRAMLTKEAADGVTARASLAAVQEAARRDLATERALLASTEGKLNDCRRGSETRHRRVLELNGELDSAQAALKQMTEDRDGWRVRARAAEAEASDLRKSLPNALLETTRHDLKVANDLLDRCRENYRIADAERTRLAKEVAWFKATEPHNAEALALTRRQLKEQIERADVLEQELTTALDGAVKSVTVKPGDVVFMRSLKSLPKEVYERLSQRLDGLIPGVRFVLTTDVVLDGHIKLSPDAVTFEVPPRCTCPADGKGGAINCPVHGVK